MIYLAVPAGDEVIASYVCDCQNPWLEEEITTARAHPSPDASLALDITQCLSEQEVKFCNPN